LTKRHITAQRSIRVAVVDGNDLWVDSPREFVRVCAVDLRGVAHRAASVCEEHPGLDVLVDIDVIIDTNAAAARDRMAVGHVIPHVDTLTYVGTPAGLVGLITDIHALGMCDGAVLRPLLPGVIGLIRDRVIPELSATQLDQLLPCRSWPA
jgi:alkanesulfonate monooxygenase SsuD/methylene tetrahydromethanopterin reductase-like flavin-dependent oxidoreductase (luciferase family)